MTATIEETAAIRSDKRIAFGLKSIARALAFSHEGLEFFNPCRRKLAGSVGSSPFLAHAALNRLFHRS